MFDQSSINHCVYAQDDCIFVARTNVCLEFYKTKSFLYDLVKYLKSESKRADEGDFESCLGIKKNNALELARPYLVQITTHTFNLDEDSKKNNNIA